MQGRWKMWISWWEGDDVLFVFCVLDDCLGCYVVATCLMLCVSLGVIKVWCYDTCSEVTPSFFCPSKKVKRELRALSMTKKCMYHAFIESNNSRCYAYCHTKQVSATIIGCRGCQVQKMKNLKTWTRSQGRSSWHGLVEWTRPLINLLYDTDLARAFLFWALLRVWYVYLSKHFELTKHNNTIHSQITNHTYKKYLQYLHPTKFFIFHLIETGDETAIPLTVQASGLPGDREYAPSKHEENQCKQTNGTVETFVAPNKS